MLRRGFKTEIRWLLLVIVVFGTIGFLNGHFLITLLIVFAAHTIWQYSRLYKLESWVNEARRVAPPEDELQGVCADIADDVNLMHNRHEKEKQRLETVVHRVQEMTTALNDGVILIDSRGNMEWWNRAAGELFNLQAVDLGQKVTNLIRFPRFVRYFESGKYSEPLDYTLPNKSGMHVEFVIHRFGQGERLIVIRDISRLTKLEQMRKDFVANVSHELRTPLTVLRGYLETLEDAGNIPPSWEKALKHMLSQTSRMTSLTNDLIALSKLETDEKEQGHNIIDLGQLIEVIAADARSLSGTKNHTISTNTPTGETAIYGRENELRSAISNLVFNAVNYTPDNGQILIQVEQDKMGTVISVSDNGEGIESRHISRLTERFYRVDASRSADSGGTGLGLAIVKHVLLRHNAELRIHSAVGRGSEFSCHFPPARTANQQNNIRRA